MATPNELGRLAFETFTKWMKGRRKPLEDPEAWDKLAGNIQQAWTAAAMRVADDAAHRVYDSILDEGD